MDIVTIECPNCGGNVERRKGEYFGRCPFCGIEIGFDEMKEEVHFDNMQQKINALENQDRIDFINRNALSKWIKQRNAFFTIITIVHFIGFALVETRTQDSGEFRLGVILMLLTYGAVIFLTPILSGKFPGYIDVYGRPDKSGKAKVKMWLKLFIIAFLLCFLSAFASVCVFEDIF